MSYLDGSVAIGMCEESEEITDKRLEQIIAHYAAHGCGAVSSYIRCHDIKAKRRKKR
jgi:hypothetical protein